MQRDFLFGLFKPWTHLSLVFSYVLDTHCLPVCQMHAVIEKSWAVEQRGRGFPL